MALRTYLTGIADAIREKKGTSDPINAQDFASEISSISTGGGDSLWENMVTGRAGNGEKLFQGYSGDISVFNFDWVTNADYMFDSSKQITWPSTWTLSLPNATAVGHLFSNSTTTSVGNLSCPAATAASYLFQRCSSVTTIGNIDLPNVNSKIEQLCYNNASLTSIGTINAPLATNAIEWFSYCSQLTSIGAINISASTNCRGMFQNCSKLESLGNIIWNTSANVSFQNICQSASKLQEFKAPNTIASSLNTAFSACYAIHTIDLGGIDQAASMYDAFRTCCRLTKLIIRSLPTGIPTYSSTLYSNYHFTGDYNFSYNPDALQDGRIYVPDDKVDEMKAATGWSEFADVIVPLSTLVED